MSGMKKQDKPGKKTGVAVHILTSYDFSKYRKNKFYYSPAQMFSCDKNDVYLEVDHPLQPSSNIRFKLENQLTAGEEFMRGRVQWCKEIDGTKGKLYEAGIKLVEKGSHS